MHPYFRFIPWCGSSKFWFGLVNPINIFLWLKDSLLCWGNFSLKCALIVFAKQNVSLICICILKIFKSRFRYKITTWICVSVLCICKGSFAVEKLVIHFFPHYYCTFFRYLKWGKTWIVKHESGDILFFMTFEVILHFFKWSFYNFSIYRFFSNRFIHECERKNFDQIQESRTIT